MIRELTQDEIEQVNGGFGFPGAVMGAVGSGVASWSAGDSPGQVAVNAGWGLVAGFTGGYAVANPTADGVIIPSGPLWIQWRMDRIFGESRRSMTLLVQLSGKED